MYPQSYGIVLNVVRFVSGSAIPLVRVEVWEKKGDLVGRAQLQVDLNQSCAPTWIKLEGKYVQCSPVFVNHTLNCEPFGLAVTLCSRCTQHARRCLVSSTVLEHPFCYHCSVMHLGLSELIPLSEKLKTRKKRKRRTRRKTEANSWPATQWSMARRRREYVAL